MSNHSPTFLVVTDLDGTLLDHHTYSWQAAEPSLVALKKLGIPVVINTSKTFEEVVALQKTIGIEAPFIVENGSAVLLPKSQFSKPPEGLEEKDSFYLKVMGQKRDVISYHINSLREENNWKFESYSDWNVEKVAEITGLDLESAALSHARAFSEPLIWNDSDANLELFKIAIKEKDLNLLKGGRFYHVLGNSNKGVATLWLKSLYPEGIPLVCLGDSPNDIDMLDVADIPVLIKSAKKEYPTLTRSNPNAIKTTGLGPVGWSEALTQILQKY